AAYPAHIAACEPMNLASERMAQALNDPSDWIHFGPSSSANTYILGHAFAGWLKPGDAIIVTNQDHEANTGAWRRLAQHGIEVRERGVDDLTGELSLSNLDNQLEEKERLVAMSSY